MASFLGSVTGLVGRGDNFRNLDCSIYLGQYDITNFSEIPFIVRSYLVSIKLIRN